MNIRKMTVGTVALGCAAAAFADFSIDLDVKAKPIKDMSTSGCNQGIGFNAVTMPGKVFAASTYRTVTCPEEFLDCSEIPGDGRPWRQLGWEDTNFGYWYADMAMYLKMKELLLAVGAGITAH